MTEMDLQAKLLGVNEEIRSLRRRQGLDRVQQTDEASEGESLQWQQKQNVNKSRKAFDNLEILRARRAQLLEDIDQKNAAIEEALLFPSKRLKLVHCVCTEIAAVSQILFVFLQPRSLSLRELLF